MYLSTVLGQRKYQLSRWTQRLYYVAFRMPRKRFSSYLQYHGLLPNRKTAKLKANKSFCVLPWTHLFIDPIGEAYPCCIANPSAPSFGSIKNESIESLWNSVGIRQLRLDMLNDRSRPDICGTCYKREKTEGTSHRVEFNKKFFHQIDKKVSQTKDDGTLEDLNWSYWDFRLSNKCNFKCRTCGPAYSTAWQAELKSIDAGVREAHKPAWKTGFDFFIKNSQSVEEIYFAGGEPLLIDEHYELLEWLIANNKTDIVLSYNTNLSQLEYKNWKILNLWRQFKHIYVSPSIDHFGDKAEYIRKGTHFESLEKNLKTILQESNIQVHPTMTISMFNILDFHLIHEYYMNLGLIKNVNHFAANILRLPKRYQIAVLPEHLKRQVRHNLHNYNNLLIKKYNDGLACYEMILSALDDDQSHLFPHFIQATQDIDVFRNENLFHHFPEFYVQSPSLDYSL